MELQKVALRLDGPQSRQRLRHSAGHVVDISGRCRLSSRPKHKHSSSNTSWSPSLQSRRVSQLAVAAPGLPVTSPGPSPESSLEEFTAWLVAAGVHGIGSPDSTVQLCDLGGGERGLVCTQAVAAGGVLLRIPYTLLIVDQPEDKAADMLMYRGAPGSVRLAARLLRERAVGPSSPWWPYISTLPATVACMVNDFKSQSELDALEYPAIANTLQGYASLLKDAYTKCSPEALAGASYEEFEWAMTVIASRCLEADPWELMMWAGGAHTHDSDAIDDATHHAHTQHNTQHDTHQHSDAASTASSMSMASEPDDDGSALAESWWAHGYLQMLMKVVNSRHLMTGTPNRGAGMAALRFLAPLLDMINHAPKPPAPDSGIPDQPGPVDNVRWSLQFNVDALKPSGVGRTGQGRSGGAAGGFSGWEIQVVATRDLQPGQELHFCYRNEEGNDSFLLHYGFLPGTPSGANPWDDVLLFPGGLEQALEWHCQEFVVKEDGIPLLQSLANDELMLLYQDAYDAGNAALSQDTYASKSAQSAIKMQANGKPPECLLAAFSAVMKGALQIAGVPDEPPPPVPAPAPVPAVIDFSQPLPRVPGKRSSSLTAGTKGKGRFPAAPAPPPPPPVPPKPPKQTLAKTHGEAAMARLCMQRLAAMTPVLQDMYTMSTAATQAVAAQTASQLPGLQVGQVRELQNAVAWAKQVKEYQVAIEAASDAVMDDALVLEQDEAVPAGMVPPLHLPSQGAVQLLQLAGVGSMDQAGAQSGFSYAAALAAGNQVEQQEGASWPGGAGYLRQAPTMAAAAAADVQGIAGGVSPRARQLAVQYRCNKKRILWDYLLTVSPKALQQALAVGIRVAPPDQDQAQGYQYEDPLLDYGSAFE